MSPYQACLRISFCKRILELSLFEALGLWHFEHLELARQMILSPRMMLSPVHAAKNLDWVLSNFDSAAIWTLQQHLLIFRFHLQLKRPIMQTLLQHSIHLYWSLARASQRKCDTHLAQVARTDAIEIAHSSSAFLGFPRSTLRLNLCILMRSRFPKAEKIFLLGFSEKVRIHSLL